MSTTPLSITDFLFKTISYQADIYNQSKHRCFCDTPQVRTAQPQAIRMRTEIGCFFYKYEKSFCLHARIAGSVIAVESYSTPNA